MAGAKSSASYWLVKSEPSAYSWQDLVRDGKARWDGIRNFEARNNLRAMRVGDLVLVYHSGDGKEAVGIARVAREAYDDPGEPAADWAAVDLAPVRPLATSVTLARMKSEPALAQCALLKRARLSVVALSEREFLEILRLAKTKP
jgi:predicted RNA-binding protein with PUA-like domain